jgi:hypothetical protein
MKHNSEDCKIKLNAIWSLAQQIKLGVKEDVEPHVLVMLAELIQQDTTLLEQEETPSTTREA